MLGMFQNLWFMRKNSKRITLSIESFIELIYDRLFIEGNVMEHFTRFLYQNNRHVNI